MGWLVSRIGFPQISRMAQICWGGWLITLQNRGTQISRIARMRVKRMACCSAGFPLIDADVLSRILADFACHSAVAE